MAGIFENDKGAVMKNVAIINCCDWGSTGKIAKSLHDGLKEKGYDSFFYYGRGERIRSKDIFKFETDAEVYVHAGLAKLTGLYDAFSIFATFRLIHKLRERRTDTIIILNYHDYYLNINLLLDYADKANIKVVYLMVDNYAYVARNGYLSRRKLRRYKRSNNILFVGPQFVIDSAKQTQYGEYMRMQSLDEAIDISLYKPCDTSQLRAEMGIAQDKLVVLCVAPSTNPIKGAKYFTEMTKSFIGDDRYVFIHIGYRDGDTSSLPANYIPIVFVKENSDLAKYYSMADLFVFPSLVDTMSNTCLEALACGTPLLVFNISGMPYLLDDSVGTMVETRNSNALADEVRKAQKKTPEVVSTCRKYAEKRYDNREYLDKLEEIIVADVWLFWKIV